MNAKETETQFIFILEQKFWRLSQMFEIVVREYIAVLGLR